MTLVRFNEITYRNPLKRQRTIRAVALMREVCSGLVEKIVVKLLRWDLSRGTAKVLERNICVEVSGMNRARSSETYY